MMNKLSLAELQRTNRGTPHGEEQRFCCPLLACAEKPKTAAHRSLAVNLQSGEYFCHRCGAKGILTEFQTRQHQDRKASHQSSPASHEAPDSWRSHLNGMQPLFDEDKARTLGYMAPECDSAAASYLRSRGISPMVPRLCDVRYHQNWLGSGEAVLFPILDMQGILVAAQGRFLHPQADQPKAMTVGPVKSGVFRTPFALAQTTVTICEAPIDALSLAICGVPAVATCGAKIFPDWLPGACVGKRVVIAHDPDKGGNEGAELLKAALVHVGIMPVRLTPPPGGDWNDYLQRSGQTELIAH